MEKSQNGFVVLEVALVLALVVLIGGAGWYVWRNRTSTTPLTSTQAITPTPAAQQPVSYFTVKEWNVRAPYSGSLTLQYAVSDTNNMSLSSKQLADGGPEVCSSTPNSEAGILSRYLPTDSNLGPRVPASETAQQYIDLNTSTPHAKIGGYIYIYWGNNYLKNGSYPGPCTDKIAAEQTIEAFSNITTHLQAIK